MLAVHKIIHHAAFQGTRTIKRHQRRYIVKAFGLQANEQILHAGAFQLKDAGGVPGSQQAIGIGIKKIQIQKIRNRFALILDHLKRPCNDRKVSKPQEIKLDQADFLDTFHVKLGDNFPFFPPIHGQIINQRPISYDHTCCVGRGMTGKSFKNLTDVDEICDFRPAFHQFHEFGLLFKGLIQADVEYIRNHFGDGVHFAQGNVQSPSHVPNHCTGFELSKGNDLADIIAAAVAIHHIFIHLLPAVDAKIHVNIRHAFSAWVQEPFKYQSMFKGIKIGYSQRKGHKASGCGPTARTYGNLVILGVLDKIRNNQKIAGKTHLLDGSHLVFQANQVGLLILIRMFFKNLAPYPRVPFAGFFIKDIVCRTLARGFIFGEMEGFEIKFQVASPCNSHCIGKGAGIGFKIRDHFVPGFEIELVCPEFEALRVMNGFSGLNAEQHIMGPDIILIQVMTVIGRNQRNRKPLTHIKQYLIDMILDVDAVVLNLQEKIPLAKNVEIKPGGFICCVLPAVLDEPGNFAMKTC